MCVFAIARICIEREVLIWSKLIKSFDCIDQFDTEIIRNGLISSKIPEPKNMGREKPLWRGHSNIRTEGSLFCFFLNSHIEKSNMTVIEGWRTGDA